MLGYLIEFMIEYHGCENILRAQKHYEIIRYIFFTLICVQE